MKPHLSFKAIIVTAALIQRLRGCAAAWVVLAMLAGAAPLHAQQYSWSTFAGAGGVQGSADTPGYFNSPFGIARDSSGNVLVADLSNHTVRMITPGGVVSVFAGQAGVPGSADGAKTATARFNSPAGVAVDSMGNVYVTDFGNHTIRKIAGGTVTTLAGTVGVIGGADGTGPAASFNGPGQMTCDTLGNLYLGDFYGHTIRKVTPAGVVTTLAGLAGSFGSADGTGSAARFSEPTGIAVDAQGTVYVCDELNFTIRKITPAGVVTTLAGLAGTSGAVDGTGSAARFTLVYGLAFDSAGNLIVTERGRLFSGSNNLIRKVTPAGVVTTLAGLPGIYGTTADGAGSNARFNFLGGVINDGTSNTLLVVETDASVIRRVSYDGVCTTWVGTPGVAGAADSVGTFDGPFGMVRDSSGNFFVTDLERHVIRKITPAGVLSTFAGQSGTSGSTDATGGAARFKNPWGIAIDAASNLYVADNSNHTIRKITPAGEVTTLACEALFTGSADGTGNAARFNGPAELKFDSTGTQLLVADNQNFTIRKVVIATGAVTTFAGLADNLGSTNGTGNAARFNYPSGIAVDAAGNVFVGDSSNHTLRKITSAGVVTTLAGLAGTGGSADGTGSAARFNYPYGLVFDSAGNLLVADRGNNTLRKVTPAGVVTTLAGLAGVSGDTDGVGSAARLNDPTGLMLDAFGNIYVACYQPSTIRKVTPGGAVTTFVGAPGLFATTNTGGNFKSPSGTAVDTAGNVYVADRQNHTIRKTTPGGVISTLAGQVGVPGNANGTGTAAQFSAPNAVAVDSAGNVYVADNSNHTIRKVTAAGLVTTLAGQAAAPGSVDGVGNLAQLNTPYGICVDPAGVNLYVADIGNHTIRKVVISSGAVTTLAGQAGVNGTVDGSGTAARFGSPSGTAVDAVGNVFVTEFVNSTIRKITPAGVVTTLAGLAGNFGNADGTGAAARFNQPMHVALDAAGVLYVTDYFNHTIRRVNTTTGAVTTIGGLAGNNGIADGTSNTVRFHNPSGIALDAAGNLYVGDESNRTIRKGTRVGAKARIVTPVNGSALPAPVTVFGWEAGLGATAYWLSVGTTPGGTDIYSASQGLNLFRVLSLPADKKVYVTLWTQIGGVWQANYYQYNPAPSQRGVVISPAQGSTLHNATLNLQWAAGLGCTQYAIYVGSAYNGTDLGNATFGIGANTASFPVPTDGGPIYVSLWSKVNGVWQRSDSWYNTFYAAGNRPAKLTVPALNGSTLAGATTTFTWDTGVGATSYHLYVGSAPDGSDLYNANQGINTTTNVILPVDGRKVYVTLFSIIGGAYQSNSYHFTCAKIANPGSQVLTPAPGDTLGNGLLGLTWSAVTGATRYHLDVGTTPGGKQIYTVNQALGLAQNVVVPTDGSVLHVTLWTLLNGVWHQNTAWYNAANTGGTQRARIISHNNGTSLPSASTNFAWDAGNGSSSYWLYVGSTQGGTDIYSANQNLLLTRAVTLPTDGRKIYVTLFTVIGGVYVPSHYLFTAPLTPAARAILTSPANGSTLTSANATFNWQAGSTGTTQYHLYIGSKPGASDLFSGGAGVLLTKNATGLPTDGRPIYLSLYSLINGVWQSNDYFFNAWQAP